MLRLHAARVGETAGGRRAPVLGEAALAGGLGGAVRILPEGAPEAPQQLLQLVLLPARGLRGERRQEQPGPAEGTARLPLPGPLPTCGCGKPHGSGSGSLPRKSSSCRRKSSRSCSAMAAASPGTASARRTAGRASIPTTCGPTPGGIRGSETGSRSVAPAPLLRLLTRTSPPLPTQQR